MTTITRRESRELMNHGYEMGARVLNGVLRRRSDGTWVLDDRPLEEWLTEIEGQLVVMVMAGVSAEGGEKRVCAVCGAAFEGYECPNCRRARHRLRG